VSKAPASPLPWITHEKITMPGQGTQPDDGKNAAMPSSGKVPRGDPLHHAKYGMWGSRQGLDEEGADPPGAAQVKTAIVGSTGFSPPVLLKLIQDTPGIILTRKTKQWGVDQFVSAVCLYQGRDFTVYDNEGPSRGGAFVRDLALLNDADKVIALFAPDRVMEGGTAHIVNKALDERKEVEAYTVDDQGELVLVGGHNPRTDTGA
jgi:hypothetical protein